MKPYRNRDQILIFHIQRVINITLLMPDIQILEGILLPYKGINIRYHLPDFRCGHTAAIREHRRPKEKFNYLHSSLQNIIERTFGVWKARWVLLRDMHVNYKYKNQVKIVIASMAIHNYIRKIGRFYEAFNTAHNES
uniref:DDE Tnp4 domain-containing protein n=1 Tax=Lactuca sativa TaxID=4236 RepID=A0A9R1XH15_LACSA|nr:hypothetical protein LSAT_V11C400206960 [Lactuca sativa]